MRKGSLVLSELRTVYTMNSEKRKINRKDKKKNLGRTRYNVKACCAHQLPLFCSFEASNPSKLKEERNEKKTECTPILRAHSCPTVSIPRAACSAILLALSFLSSFPCDLSNHLIIARCGIGLTRCITCQPDSQPISYAGS